jgi:ABC-type transporter Mla subunit MlaD
MAETTRRPAVTAAPTLKSPNDAAPSAAEAELELDAPEPDAGAVADERAEEAFDDREAAADEAPDVTEAMAEESDEEIDAAADDADDATDDAAELAEPATPDAEPETMVEVDVVTLTEPEPEEALEGVEPAVVPVGAPVDPGVSGLPMLKAPEVELEPSLAATLI